jgi:hypothetical protein
MVSPEKSSLSPVQRSGRYVLVLFIVSVAIRAVFLVHYKMIDTDSAYYGNIARLFAAGHWQKALDPYWPPLYPFFASLLFRLGIGLEASGILVSLFASAGLGAVLLLFLTNFSISSQSWPTLYKKAGVWLKSHADRPVVLSSRKPETSFYAEAEFRPLNAQKIEDLFDVLKNGNITHLVIDDYIMPSSHPQLADLLDPRRAPPWLIPLFFETQDGHTLILYKFQGS